jgi:hypothetical protein
MHRHLPQHLALKPSPLWLLPPAPLPSPLHQPLSRPKQASLAGSNNCLLPRQHLWHPPKPLPRTSNAKNAVAVMAHVVVSHAVKAAVDAVKAVANPAVKVVKAVKDAAAVVAVVDAAVLSARPPVSVNALMPKANPWPKT